MRNLSFFPSPRPGALRALRVLLVAAFLGSAPLSLFADTVKLKDGTELEGTVISETDDLIRIEVQFSDSIKNIKLLNRADVAQVLKTPPDVVAFNKLSGMVPTGSLLTPAEYRTLIETGPKDFLAKHPDSQHKEKVEEILATLEEELDKAERGFIKLEDDWISPKDQREYESQVESRKLLLQMEEYAAARDPHAAIRAMRFFESLESEYFGTPAFARAVPLALETIPFLGQRLQSMSNSVDVRNAQWEEQVKILNEYDRKQVEQARAREEAQYQAGLAEDKKNDLKWVRLNPNSKESIENYLKLATEELQRLKGYDVDALAQQAEMLVKADDYIVEKRFDLADRSLDKASEINVMLGEGSSGKRSRRKKGGSSYFAVLSEKLDTRREEEEADRKAREEAKASEEAAKALQKKEKEKAAAETDGEGEESEEESEEEKVAKADALSRLAQASSGKKEEDDEKKEEDGEKESRKESTADKDEDDDRDRRPPPDAGGGFPMWIVPVFFVLLLVVVVALKFLGIGGKKDDEEEEEDEGEEEK